MRSERRSRNPSDLPAPVEGDLLEEREYNGFLIKRALELMASEFEPRQWQASVAYITEGRSANDVAAQFGMSANAVRIAKCRVLRRLREELAGLIEV